MIYNCALDGGNSTINIVIDGEKFPRPFPSIQSDPLPAKANYNNAIFAKNLNKQLWNKLHVEAILHKENGENGKDYFRSEFLFGHMAEEYQKDLRSRGNREKYQDKDLAKWMLTALSYALLEKKMENENYIIKQNDRLQFNINLSTGLPYREGSDEEKKLMWANLFQGLHEIHFKHPIFKGLKIDLVVENVMVLVEGEMALNLELNKDGGVFFSTSSELLLNKKMAMIDIGGHTTEIVTIAYELDQDDSYDEYDLDDDDIVVRPVTKAHLTDGIQRGILTIMADVITEVEEEYRKTGKPLRKLTTRDIELAFTKKGRLEGKVGWILPEAIYVKDIFDRQAMNLGMDIVQKIHSLYQGHTISEVDTIYLCGGGSRIDSLVNVIKKELSALGYNEDKLIPLDDPVFANAKGYYLALSQYFNDGEELAD